MALKIAGVYVYKTSAANELLGVYSTISKTKYLLFCVEATKNDQFLKISPCVEATDPYLLALKIVEVSFLLCFFDLINVVYFINKTSFKCLESPLFLLFACTMPNLTHL